MIAFDAGEKAGVVLLDLSAAYDTVWLRGLHLKLLQMIPDRHMVKFIMEMLYNRSFTLNTSDGQCSRQRRLKNGVPQGSVLAPMLFNVYIHDLPVTQAKKYGYADDLAILLQKKSWEDIEGGLTADMTILSTYLENWRLKLSIAKTMSSVFHLHNREANREINITVNGNRLQAAVPVCTNLPGCETGAHAVVSPTPGKPQCEDHCTCRPDPPPCGNHMGSRYQDPESLHPGIGLLCCRVLRTSLVP